MGLSPHRTSPEPTTTPAAPAVAGVVWDLGNVLVRWDPLEAIAAGVGREEGARFLDEFDFHTLNRACDAGRPWAEAVAEVERETPQWTPHIHAYVAHFEHSLTGEVPGSGDVLRELKAAGVPQIGLTNWSSETFEAHAVRLYPVLTEFADIVVSGDEGVAKPDPAIYRIAAERIGLPLERLVFVDDRHDNVEAARALGMHGIVFTGATRLRRELAGLGLLPPRFG